MHLKHETIYIDTLSDLSKAPSMHLYLAEPLSIAQTVSLHLIPPERRGMLLNSDFTVATRTSFRARRPAAVS